MLAVVDALKLRKSIQEYWDKNDVGVLQVN